MLTYTLQAFLAWSASTLSEPTKPQGNGKNEGLLIIVECKDKLLPSPGISEQLIEGAWACCLRPPLLG